MLEDLEKKLYKQADREDIGRRIKERPVKSEEITKEFERRKEVSLPEEEIKPEQPRRKKRIIFAGSFLIIIAVFAGALIFYYTRQSFDTSLVTLKISGPRSFVAGDNLVFKVNYKNSNKVALRDAEIAFEWPEDSLPAGETIRKVKKEIPLISPGREATVEFEGMVFGIKDEKIDFRAVLSYRPENLSSQFETEAEFGAKIDSTPVSLNIEVPPLAVSDKEFEITVNYLNSSDASFSDISLKIVYPVNFMFISSAPGPTFSNNQWFLGNLGGRKNGAIKIKGKLTSSLETNQFKTLLGVQKGFDFISYAEDIDSIEISSSALVVFSQINNSRDYITSAGEILNFKINYKNASMIPIANIVVSAKIEGAVLDLKTLNVPWGAYDGRSGAIIWNVSGVKDLALLNPRQEGEVLFSIQVKKPLPIAKFSDKNFKVNFTAKIDSQLIPELLKGAPIGMEESLEIKIKSDVFLKLTGFYKDNLFGNTGPIPPRVGSKTTYTVFFNLTNTANDLDNVQLETFLPSYVEWLNKVSPAGADVSFDPATGRLIANIGKLGAGAGITSKVFQLAFQIAIVPAPNQIGSSPLLVGDTTLKAKDAFTLLDLETTAKGLTTELTDPTVSPEQGKVAQ